MDQNPFGLDKRVALVFQTLQSTNSRMETVQQTSAAAAAGDHSTAREAFVLMSTLLSTSVPRAYLDLCANILQERHMRDVFEERAVQRRCGWPICRELLPNRRPQKYRVSAAKQQLYSAREEQQFCTTKCLEDARRFLGNLPVKPPQMLPSITQVFGTPKPNPKDYDGSGRPTTTPAAAAPARLRQAVAPRVVWAKQPGMGVVEKDIQIVEHDKPAKPSTDFSTTNPVLIEGYIFPAHKAKKASKVAKVLTKEAIVAAATTAAIDFEAGGDDDDEQVTSSEDESSGSEVDDDDDESADSEGNTDVFSAADLSSFATLWWKVSEMVTPATLHLVARWSTTSAPPSMDAPLASSVDLDNRRLFFGTFCARQLPAVVAMTTGLRHDRGIHMQLNDVVQTLELRRPLEGTHATEWNTMCLVLLLVVHGRTTLTWRATITPDALRTLCGVDPAEMDQLLTLFSAADANMDAIVLGDELDAPASAVTAPSSSSEAKGPMCRKCRHRTCICKDTLHTDERSDFSADEIASMMKESLKIQEMSEFGTCGFEAPCLTKKPHLNCIERWTTNAFYWRCVELRNQEEETFILRSKFNSKRFTNVAMSKEATMIVLDASVAMRSPLAEVTRKVSVGSRFDAAKSAIHAIVNQKLLFRAKDEVGLVLYGTHGTDNPLFDHDGGYKHVTVLSGIAPVSTSLVKQIAAAEPASEETPADILDGIIVGLDLMIRATDKKKYDRRLVVITDAATRINNPADMEVVCTMIQNLDVQLQIFGIDFSHLSSEPIKSDDVSPQAAIKIENEKMLLSIATEVGGDVQSVTKRIDFLAHSKLKPVKQTSKMRGNLEFGSTLSIPIAVFSKVMEATVPSLVKESQVAKEDGAYGKVKMDRTFFSTTNPDEEVPPERRVKAYKYGSEMIPFSAADQAALKLTVERGIKILGFVDLDQWTSGQGMTGTDAVVGDFSKPKAQEALHAFSEALAREGKFALGRYVRAANAAPKVVALFPNTVEPRLHCLWMVHLPFEEDLRLYEFASLQSIEPTSDQQTAADLLVDALSRPATTTRPFHPTLQRLYDTLAARALDESAPLASLPPFVERHLREDKDLFGPAVGAIQAFDGAFALKKAVHDKDKAKRAFWSDVKTEGASGDANQEAAAAADTDAGGDGDLDLDDLLGDDVSAVGSMNPISDFEALLASQNPAKMQLAVTGMESQILALLTHDASHHSKGVDVLEYFRRRSPQIHRTAPFNAFLKQLKTTLASTQAWERILQRNITLLSVRDDPSSDVSLAEAEGFLRPDVEATSAPVVYAPVVEEVSEEDLFADLE
ncbi:Aste57867_1037 [Aphanomyces stellatus]|uniref:Aste57867_1037 protein n=1 Tax=Aphanomyces stellatus TaxID=120398 RepID=A0A485K5E5_9STRA|nr:hypothetical protein As57867_001036 [Aphanomyces stellatus]VFT78259.1 Aste57867_1037 [Aphanomyces stellatus]